MAAGLGFIEFSTGDVLSASAANGYLASQTVMVFASAAARTSAIAAPQEGMVSYLKDTDVIQFYSGSAWTSVGGGASFVGCAVSNVSTGSISVSNNTDTVVTWDTEAYDTDSFHSTVTNTSRMTIPTGKGGKYIVTSKFRWDTNTTGNRSVTFYVNGTGVDGTNIAGNYASPFQVYTAVLNVSAGDYVEVYAFQDSGGTRTLNLNQNQSKFTISYLGA